MRASSTSPQMLPIYAVHRSTAPHFHFHFHSTRCVTVVMLSCVCWRKSWLLGCKWLVWPCSTPHHPAPSTDPERHPIIRSYRFGLSRTAGPCMKTKSIFHDVANCPEVEVTAPRGGCNGEKFLVRTKGNMKSGSFK